MEIDEITEKLKMIDRRLDFNDEMEKESFTTQEAARMEENASASAVKMMLFETLLHLGVSVAQINEAFHARRRWILAQLLESAETVDARISAELDQRDLEDVYTGGQIPAIPFPPRN